MNISERYKKAREDYEYLVEHHDAMPSDVTGGWGEGRWLEVLMKNPTKAQAYAIYVSLIEHTTVMGFEKGDGRGNQSNPPDFTDYRTLQIYRDYYFDENILNYYDFDIFEVLGYE